MSGHGNCGVGIANALSDFSSYFVLPTWSFPRTQENVDGRNTTPPSYLIICMYLTSQYFHPRVFQGRWRRTYIQNVSFHRCHWAAAVPKRHFLTQLNFQKLFSLRSPQLDFTPFLFFCFLWSSLPLENDHAQSIGWEFRRKQLLEGGGIMFSKHSDFWHDFVSELVFQCRFWTGQIDPASLFFSYIFFSSWEG